MKIFIVHVYDAADRLSDYHVHATIDSALRQAAIDIVEGRFDDIDRGDFEIEVRRALAETYQEPGVGRRHMRCDAWRAHIDEMQVTVEFDAAADSLDREHVEAAQLDAENTVLVEAWHEASRAADVKERQLESVHVELSAVMRQAGAEVGRRAMAVVARDRALDVCAVRISELLAEDARWRAEWLAMRSRGWKAEAEAEGLRVELRTVRRHRDSAEHDLARLGDLVDVHLRTMNSVLADRDRAREEAAGLRTSLGSALRLLKIDRYMRPVFAGFPKLMAAATPTLTPDEPECPEPDCPMSTGEVCNKHSNSRLRELPAVSARQGWGLSQNHTCTSGGKTNCAPCMKFEVELWDAVNRYAVTCGGDLECINGARMQAVVAVNAVVETVISRQRIDDLTIEDLVKGLNAAAAAACARGEKIDRLEAELARVRPVYEAVKRMRAAIPVDTSTEMRERGFHVTTCDAVEAIDQALALEPKSAPYRDVG